MSQGRGGIPGLRPDAVRPNHETVEDDYDIHERIGRGTFADVFRATNKVTGQIVAIKRIRKLQMLFSLFRKNKIDLSAEVDVMRKMDHPNIIKLFDVYENRKEVALVMEYAPGGQLMARVNELGGCPEQTTKRIIASVLSAIKYMHDNNVVHRDLKPENIVLMGDELNEVKLTDFGLSKLSSSPMKTFVGTPAYLAPEMLQGNNLVYGKEIDVWAIGIVAHFLLVGELPFKGQTNDDLYAEIRSCHILNFPSLRWLQVSEAAKDFVRSILRADPKERPSLSEALGHSWLSEVVVDQSPCPARHATSSPLRSCSSSVLDHTLTATGGMSDSDNTSDASPARVPIPWAIQRRLLEDSPFSLDSPNKLSKSPTFCTSPPASPGRSVVTASRLPQPMKKKAASMLALRFGGKGTDSPQNRRVKSDWQNRSFTTHTAIQFARSLSLPPAPATSRGGGRQVLLSPEH
eukprot:c4685_g1_i1.p1 GENE.c4685_g1_i1~~c4685_g1_i1.p1  ORF type:complete len:461 (+),score=79.98 c4685_g1_i1:109-1491(+)